MGRQTEWMHRYVCWNISFNWTSFWLKYRIRISNCPVSKVKIYNCSQFTFKLQIKVHFNNFDYFKKVTFVYNIIWTKFYFLKITNIYRGGQSMMLFLGAYLHGIIRNISKHRSMISWKYTPRNRIIDSPPCMFVPVSSRFTVLLMGWKRATWDATHFISDKW